MKTKVYARLKTTISPVTIQGAELLAMLPITFYSLLISLALLKESISAIGTRNFNLEYAFFIFLVLAHSVGIVSLWIAVFRSNEPYGRSRAPLTLVFVGLLVSFVVSLIEIVLIIGLLIGARAVGWSSLWLIISAKILIEIHHIFKTGAALRIKAKHPLNTNTQKDDASINA